MKIHRKMGRRAVTLRGVAQKNNFINDFGLLFFIYFLPG